MLRIEVPYARRVSNETSLAARVTGRLTPDRLVVYPGVVVVLFVVVWAVSLRAAFPLPDFLARWTAGSMVAGGDGASLYDPVAQSVVQAGVGAQRLSWFVSPPFVAVLFVPFGLLPYWLAAVVWTAVSLAFLAWSARAAATLHPRMSALGTGRGLLVAASCQPVLELVGGGQDCALVLASFVLGARWLERSRAFPAGMALGVGLVKPQLVVLVPLLLLATRRWRALLGFSCIGLGLAALATLVLGPGVWGRWKVALTSPLYAADVQQDQAWKNSTVYGFLHGVLPDAWGSVATVLWAVAVVGVAVATLRNWRSLREAPIGVLLLVTVPLATVLVTPHAMVYDLVLVVPAVAYLVGVREATRERALAVAAYLLLFLAPLLHLLASAVPVAGLLEATWVVLPLAALWWGHLRAERTALTGGAEQVVKAS